MRLVTRRKGSQRRSVPIPVEFVPNFTGHGSSDLVLVAADRYYFLEFESEAEVRAFLSQAHIIHHNYRS
jgi:hypothetical protein